MTASAAHRGIACYAAYLPAFVLSSVDFSGPHTAGGNVAGRSVAGFDQDAVTLGVEAARAVADRVRPGTTLLFATAQPPYLDKSAASTVHAALDLDPAAPAVDVTGLRGGAGALGLALRGGDAAVLADVRATASGAPDELRAGDAAVVFACADPAGASDVDDAGDIAGDIAGDMGGDTGGGVGGVAAATLLATASATQELLDRWRLPGAAHATVWDERFTAGVYTDLMVSVARRALALAGVAAPDQVVVACANARAAAATRRSLGGGGADAALERATGHTGTAHLGLLLADAFDRCRPGQTVLAVSAADGADAYVFAATDTIATANRGQRVADQLAARVPVRYERFLRWRGLLSVDTPRRPEPEAPAAPPSSRQRRWKFGLVAAECRECGTVAAPPVARCPHCRAAGPGLAHPLRERTCTVVSSVPDHLAYSLDPPVVRAVVDVDGGGRHAVEVTDTPPQGVAVGTVLRPTFRRLYTAGNVHNYFWKTTPLLREER